MPFFKSMKKNIEIVNFAITVILGIIIPFFFHLIGASGPIFLPMFYPIVLGGFILKRKYAVSAALITPILSSFLTGMPPINPPIAINMSIELSLMVLVISLLYNKTNFNVYLITFISIVVYVLSMIPLQYFINHLIYGLPFKSSVIVSVVRSLPGILIILFIIPNLAITINNILVKRLDIYYEDSIKNNNEDSVKKRKGIFYE